MKSNEIMKFGGMLVLQNLMAAFLSISIYLFCGTFGKFYLVGFIIGLTVYTAVLYQYSWYRGNKDMVKVHFGHSNNTSLFGLMAGLFASIPSIIMMVVLLFTVQPKTLTDELLSALARLWFGAYLYVIIQVQTTPYLYALPIIMVTLPTIVGAGYYFGMNDIRIVRKTVYKEEAKFYYPEKDSKAGSILNEKNMKNLKK